MERPGRIIAENLKRLRADSGLSLDALAKSSGVSKSRLGQIERGEANPSVETVWQIASALRVEFSALVAAPRASSAVARLADAQPVVADGGRYRTFPLFPFDAALGFEVFLSELDPGGHLHAEPHPEGTWETLVMASGTLSIEVAGAEHVLGPGDAVRFRADMRHEYRNRGEVPATSHIVITYPRLT